MMKLLHLPPLIPVRRNLVTLFCCVLFLWSVPLAGADTTVGGTISTDTTWTLAASPYIVTSNITVRGTDGADGITTLTIEPGVVVKFNRYRYINIGASSGDPGALVAQGTSENQIVLTSNQASPAAGDWYGLRIYNTADDATTRLAHCTVEYTGYYSNGAVRIQDAAPTLLNCVFNNSSYYDLYYSGTVGGTVSGCTLNSGIYLLATSQALHLMRATMRPLQMRANVRRLFIEINTLCSVSCKPVDV